LTRKGNDSPCNILVKNILVNINILDKNIAWGKGKGSGSGLHFSNQTSFFFLECVWYCGSCCGCGLKKVVL